MQREQLERLEAEIADASARIEAAGLFVMRRSILDEGTWGRADIEVSTEASSGRDLLGKVQVHLNSKGRISVVPQGALAKRLAEVLGQPVGSRTAPVVAASSSSASTSPAKTGDLVVDCSKFGQRLIGPTEWRGMIRQPDGRWKECFHSPRFERGHNNLGEFLALVEALNRCARGEFTPKSIWSDSRTAISWLTKGAVKTKIDIRGDCDGSFAAAVASAQSWLESPQREAILARGPRVQLWDTPRFGENPADFGRK